MNVTISFEKQVSSLQKDLKGTFRVNTDCTPFVDFRKVLLNRITPVIYIEEIFSKDGCFEKYNVLNRTGNDFLNYLKLTENDYSSLNCSVMFKIVEDVDDNSIFNIL